MSTSKRRKKDFRRGDRASLRKDEAQSAIRKALSYGEACFGDLLEKTGLSRPALASNLKEMHRKREIERRKDHEDYRITHYSLTAKGTKAYEKQKDLDSLRDMEALSMTGLMNIIKASMMNLMDAVTYVCESPQLVVSRGDQKKQKEGPPKLFINVSDQKKRIEGQDYAIWQNESPVFPQLNDEEREILNRCLAISVYSRTTENETRATIPTSTELLGFIRAIASRQEIDIERLNQLPNLTFMFQFQGNKLLEQYNYRRKTGSNQSEKSTSAN
jgi:DNA-binding MarR family transcriptional regulator